MMLHVDDASSCRLNVGRIMKGEGFDSREYSMKNCMEGKSYNQIYILYYTYLDQQRQVGQLQHAVTAVLCDGGK